LPFPNRGNSASAEMLKECNRPIVAVLGISVNFLVAATQVIRKF
jgi:hypothetical protein